MTCHDARELFSALIDETLTRDERADVYGHLATCADCRRELAAVERTVALIRGTPPVRAPVGFVDRVVAATRPAPWYVRATRAALLPWPVKLPLGAAALLLVGGLAVLMFRGAEEQPRPGRDEAAPALADRLAQAPPPTPESAPARRAERALSSGAREAAPPGVPSPPAANESRDTAATAKLESPRVASTPAPRADVVVRLGAPERDTAARGLAALAARLAGGEIGRRVAGDALVVELALPRDRYGDFRREAARFGDYRTESEPPTLPETVRIDVHLRP